MKAKVLLFALGVLVPAISWSAPVDPSYWETQRDVIIDDGFVYTDGKMTGCYEGYYLMDYIGENSEVIIPDSVSMLSTAVFRERHHVKSITIPASVITIDGGANGAVSFQFCDNLEAFYVQEGSTIWSADNGVLFNTDKTKLVKYPPKKTDEKYTIPATVTEIDDFTNNPFVKEITMETTTPPTTKTFGRFTQQVKLRVPIGSADNYAKAPWNEFTIEEYVPASIISEKYLATDDITVISAPGTDAITVRLREGIALKSVQLFDLSGRMIYSGTSPDIRKAEIGGSGQGCCILRVRASHGDYAAKTVW